MVEVPIGNDGIAEPVTFSAAGGAKAFCGPSGVGASWSPAQATVSTSVGPLDVAQVAVYIGPLPLPQYLLISQIAGGFSQIPLGGVQLDPGWFIWAVWTGGASGEIGYLTVTGLKQALTM
jgi:hypothetical protein